MFYNSPVPLQRSRSHAPALRAGGGLTSDNHHKLEELFRHHLKEKHPRTEDFSQAAARIVRESTQDQDH